MKLIIKNLTKKYSNQQYGLKDVNMNIQNGIIGLVGKNGAGKSTLMRLIATISRPTEGQIFWNGEDTLKKPDFLRKVLGYLPQDFGVYPNLNAIEFLEYIAALKGLHSKDAKIRIHTLLEELNLSYASKKQLHTYSGGMKQRLGIAQMLLNDPQLLILDEPTTGLDPEERMRFRNLLSDLSQDRIVILSSHIVSDIEAMATEIAILNHGSLLTISTPEKMIKMVEGKVFEITLPFAEFNTFKKEYRISTYSRKDENIIVRFLSQTSKPSFHAVSPILEDAYFGYISDIFKETLG